jgi:hypothetical protein
MALNVAMDSVEYATLSRMILLQVKIQLLKTG